MTRAGLEKALNKIYRGPPADFIRERNALVKKLGAEGDEDDAARVKGLRKPSSAAGVVNALALDRPRELKRYLGLSDKLRKATSRKVDSEKMRALAREEGERLEELVSEARGLDDGASAATLDRVRETLQAAQVDSELRKTVSAGRLEREQRAASIGLDNLAAPPEAARGPRGKPAEPARSDASAKEAKHKQLREARAQLAHAKAEAREAAREVARAERDLAKAERGRDSAEGRVARADAKVESLA